MVGFLFTYIAPLVLVLGFTLAKEYVDDRHRQMRDRETNDQMYTLIGITGRSQIASRDVRVGHVLEIKSNQRIPADMVVLNTSEDDGTVFIRTDQLDGETDWKLRKALTFTQQYLKNNKEYSLLGLPGTIDA